jgi:hypothetical protein
MPKHRIDIRLPLLLVAALMVAPAAAETLVVSAARMLDVETHLSGIVAAGC